MRKRVSVALVLFAILLDPGLVNSISHQLNNSMDWSAKLEEYIGNGVRIQFMPGTYEVQYDTLITNVSNFSIEGDNTSGSYVTFSCSNMSSWIIASSSFIEIKNVRFLNCVNTYDPWLFKGVISSDIKAAIFIYNVSSIKMVDVTIENSCGYGIIALNIVGMCTFEHVTIHGNDTLNTFCDKYSNNTIFGGMVLLNLRLNDNETLQEDTIISIKHCLFFNIQAIWHDEIINSIEYFNSSVIGLVLYQAKYHIDVNIENISITNITNTKRSIISISYSMNSTSNVTIANSSITYINVNYSIVEINYEAAFNITNTTLLDLFCLTSCKFYHNQAKYVLRMKNIYNNSMSMQLKNNVFKNNTVRGTLLITKAVVPQISGYLNFSSNKANIVFSMTNYVLLDDGAVFSFTNNSRSPLSKIKYKFLIKKNDQSSPVCPFQLNNSTNVSIKFFNNTDYYRAVYGNSLFGCTWIPNSFLDTEKLPSEVYSEIIHYYGDDNKGISGWENSICLCNDNKCQNHNCLKFKPFTVYPGETINITFMNFYFDIAIYTTSNESIFNEIAPPCGTYPPKTDLVFHYCTEIGYTVTTNSSQNTMCLLILKTATKEKTIYAFRVNLKNCSLGFVLDHEAGICKCHPEFASSVVGLKCDISNEAFQRPAGGWIGNDSNSIIYTSDCRLGYCLQYPSWVQLAKPDSQCLFSRSGIACGECAQGLSVVFGTSRCKKCTNYWLFLLPAFAVAGLLLVLALFALNLTVANGDIYGFILMVNALSTHDTRVFPSTTDPSWVLVSLCNLDLGIEVCFYNGMTAYSATWLRFMFPVYVLLIVVAMSFASRYFQLIEKITRKRVIPVIATLYLLSYNKLMLVTFRGLFSYTKIYYLFINDTKLYWSTDTGIPLFGAQFVLLFIFCLIVFVFVIVPTNILLISGTTLYRFKHVVMYLKPFLDVYQAPFKENCRYFLGLEVLLRGSVFASLSFAPQSTAAIYTALLIIYLVYLCNFTPFKSRFNSFIYTSYLLYMGAYVILFIRFYPFHEKQETYRLIFNLVCYASFLEFLAIITIHVWKYNLRYSSLFIKCEDFVKKYKSKYQLKFTRKDFYRPKQQVKLSSGSYENFREELLALESDT